MPARRGIEATARNNGGVPVRILTVEDDEGIRAVLRLALEDEGHEVLEAASADEGVAQFRDGDPHLVLVDLMLPDRSGFELCRELRRTTDVPIVIVTARADTHDVVAGLEAGADDYVTKPFAPKELAARIRALLRRTRLDNGSNRSTADVLSFGRLEVHAKGGVVKLDGEEVALTRTEFRLLCELATHAGMVLSREQLLERIWGYDYFGDSRLVDAHIRRLRTKLEEDPAEPKQVLTIRGLGYKLQA